MRLVLKYTLALILLIVLLEYVPGYINIFFGHYQFSMTLATTFVSIILLLWAYSLICKILHQLSPRLWLQKKQLKQYNQTHTLIQTIIEKGITQDFENALRNTRQLRKIFDTPALNAVCAILAIKTNQQYRYLESIKRLKSKIDHHPQSALLLAHCFQQKEQWQPAYLHYQKCLPHHWAQSYILTQLAHIAYSLEYIDDAQHWCNQYIEHIGTLTPTLLILQNKIHLHKITSLEDTPQWTYWNNLPQSIKYQAAYLLPMLKKQKKQSKINPQALLIEAIGKDPDSLLLNYFNHFTLDDATFETIKKKWLKKWSNNAYVHAAIGTHYSKQQQWHQALPHFEQAYKIKPETKIQLMYIKALRYLNQFNQADQLLDALINDDDDKNH